MAQFESAKEQIEKSGASVLLIAAEKPGGLFRPVKHLAEHPVSFPFLLDEDRRVTKEYGVYHRIGMDAFKIARPATIVVDRGGTIRFVHVGENQHDRVSMDMVLNALHNIQP
jgi:peroxiredoxin